jgi:hypothetical protein
MTIEAVRLDEKDGGKSGHWKNDECPNNVPPMTNEKSGAG